MQDAPTRGHHLLLPPSSSRMQHYNRSASKTQVHRSTNTTIVKLNVVQRLEQYTTSAPIHDRQELQLRSWQSSAGFTGACVSNDPTSLGICAGQELGRIKLWTKLSAIEFSDVTEVVQPTAHFVQEFHFGEDPEFEQINSVFSLSQNHNLFCSNCK